MNRSNWKSSYGRKLLQLNLNESCKRENILVKLLQRVILPPSVSIEYRFNSIFSRSTLDFFNNLLTRLSAFPLFLFSFLGPNVKIAIAILNCILARQLCFEDPSCSAILEIIPRVCGPVPGKNCSNFDRNKRRLKNSSKTQRISLLFDYVAPSCKLYHVNAINRSRKFSL